MKKTSPDSTPPSAKPARRKYDAVFKQQALSMIRNGQPARSVAQALGISENLLHQWKRSASAGQSAAEQEVEHLRQRLRQVEMERDILKKALSIFSRPT
jgi:transposase